MPDDNSTLHQLIQRARVLGLNNNPDLPASIRQIIETVDDQKRLMSSEEALALCDWSGIQPGCIHALQTEIEQLVQKARVTLLERDPTLVEPGGALHPAQRAEACWNDCWQFMRVITIAVAIDHPQFTDPEGMQSMRSLYALLGVPTEGLKIALTELKRLSIQAIDQPRWTREGHALTQAFDHLAAELNKSAVKSCKANAKY